jgi:hypothetical protein
LETQQQQKFKRVLELGPDLAIYEVDLDLLREQDKNARIMSAQKFERLVENIKERDTLESLPLCTMSENEHGNVQFPIISGHHRTRAARAAGLERIYVMVDESNLTKDQVVSKQLAHNALSGHDDPQLLKDLYESIEGIDARISSGILDQELQFDIPNVRIDEIDLALDYEIINLLFFPKQYENWRDVVDLLENDAHIGVVDKKHWDEFAKTVREVSKRDDIRNMSAVVARMVEIVKAYYKHKDKEQE